MKLHVFNPEHDIALARNDRYFTPPRAGRKLREDCGFLPALWANRGDYVLVEDPVKARKQLDSLPVATDGVNLVSLHDLGRLTDCIGVEPWGWDSALRFRLEKAGFPPRLMPDDDTLNDIRELSNRRFSSLILNELHEKLGASSENGDYIIGDSKYVDSLEEVMNEIARRDRSVLKEPWSSSGRGVRYVGQSLDEATANWVKNIIDMQGGIMVEPYYNKVSDFGMEFVADDTGVHYRGLSLFKTNNGFYEGNVIAPEEEKTATIFRSFSIEKLHEVRLLVESLLSRELKGRYHGPLGVDMMLVETAKAPGPGCNVMSDTNQDKGLLLLHPMVEINLRRTMGHVAIDLSNKMEGHTGFMCIDYTKGNYNLVIIQE